MTIKKTIVTLIFLLEFQNLPAQTDTLINYNIETGQIYAYPQAEIDSSSAFDHTEWNFGSENGFAYLSLEPPDSTYNNSGFSDLIPAQNLFSVSDYPIRTAIALFFTKNDSLIQNCSGILIAAKYVLTDCHCVGTYDTNRTLIFYDTLWAFPAYDNGTENYLFHKSAAVEYITFKSNLQGYYTKDIALIKLEDEIGIKTGWVGIAFSKDDSYFENRVFHKFSYPGEIDPVDSTRIFNGDTLYYSYGVPDLIDNGWLGYNIIGIPGQSGSSLLFTDNKEYYSFGTLVWGINSRHIRITPEIFYAFKSVINNGVADVNSDWVTNENYRLSDAYPNPFSKGVGGNSVITIEYSIPTDDAKFTSTVKVTLKVYDILGRKVATLVNKEQSPGNYSVQFNGGGLSAGIYFYTLETNNFRSAKKIMILK